MDILGFIGALNKVALFFFTITLGFVIYEFVMFLRDRKREERPQVPAFDPDAPLQQATPIHTTTQAPQPLMKSNSHRVIQLIIALTIFAIVTIVMIVFRPNTTEQLPATPRVTQTLKPRITSTPTPSEEDLSPATEAAALTPSLLSSPTATLSPIVDLTTTPSPSAIIVAEVTASASAATEPTTIAELPSAGIRFPYEWIGGAALVVVMVALIF